ncbi:23S rRNA 2'-O-ribose U2552 methyltransferase [Candidatus Tremblaya phenacola PAVE]|nr:23S rRNA 2'-O-ribose U2552 methyltransferase [Candidatus Tremblaya phenacola PAVE]
MLSWIKKQKQDAFVRKAKEAGLRSRAAFKLLEADGKFGLVKNHNTILDLGASPGSWSQYVIEKKGGPFQNYKLIAVDKIPMKRLGGSDFILGDLTKKETQDQIGRALNYHKADLILSDICPNISGSDVMDGRKQVESFHLLLTISLKFLSKSGTLLHKTFGNVRLEVGGLASNLFRTVTFFPTKATKAQSSEVFVICKNIRAGD